MQKLWLILFLMSGIFTWAFLFAAMIGFQVSLNDENDQSPKLKTWRVFDALYLGSFGSAIVGAIKNWKTLHESRQAAISGFVSLALTLLFFFLCCKAS
ncbi:MAG TPA: hypothetical protein VGH19_11860 [Verrucomicrobiae bacterium]